MHYLGMLLARLFGSLMPGSRPMPAWVEEKYTEVLSNQPMKSWKVDRANMHNDAVAVSRDFQVAYEKVKEEMLRSEAH
jgi:hypothetical protein